MIGDCDLLMGMRLHANILAAATQALLASFQVRHVEGQVVVEWATASGAITSWQT